MKTLAKRLDALEADHRGKGKHWIYRRVSWDREVVLDHYGRDKIKPGDEVVWIEFNECGLGERSPYPSGYFDSDGRWAAVLAARGIDLYGEPVA